MPARKLTDEQIRDIRVRSSHGVPHVLLQQEYGVNSSFVSNIVSGRTRRSAGGPFSAPRNSRDAWSRIPELARAHNTSDRYRTALALIAKGDCDDPVALAKAALGIITHDTH